MQPQAEVHQARLAVTRCRGGEERPSPRACGGRRALWHLDLRCLVPRAGRKSIYVVWRPPVCSNQLPYGAVSPGWCGLSASLRTKGFWVWFPVGAHAWVVGQVTSRGRTRGNHTFMFLSLPSFRTLKINKIFKQKQKWTWNLPFDPAVPLLRIHIKKPKTVIWKNICTPIFLAVLFTIADIWKQLRCLPVYEWIKICGIFAQWNTNGLWKKEISPFMTARVDLEIIMLYYAKWNKPVRERQILP